MIKKIILLTGVFLCTLGLTLGVAQTETEVEGIGEFAYGTVISIAVNKITVEEYDYDSDELKEVSYVINSQTEFINAESYMEIFQGDEVEINYKKSGDQKVAQAITKELPVALPEDYEFEYDNKENQGEYQEEEHM